MISDWTIYAIHTGYGEWLCPDCARKALDDLLGADRQLDLSDARQLWLQGEPLRLVENGDIDSSEATFEPMIGVEIDGFWGDDELICSRCSKIVYNERETRTYTLQVSITDDPNNQGLPDAEDLCSQVLEGLAPLYGEENLLIAQVEPGDKAGDVTAHEVGASDWPEAYATLRAAARHVLASWPRGDLAGAVRELAMLLDGPDDTDPELEIDVPEHYDPRPGPDDGDDSDDPTSVFWTPDAETIALAKAAGVVGLEPRLEAMRANSPVPDHPAAAPLHPVCPHCAEPVTDDHRPLVVTYEHCGTTWTSEWCCACDDECPVCGKDIEATSWTPA